MVRDEFKSVGRFFVSQRIHPQCCKKGNLFIYFDDGWWVCFDVDDPKEGDFVGTPERIYECPWCKKDLPQIVVESPAMTREFEKSRAIQDDDEETALLIPEPNDVRTIAYLLLVNGYTIRAEVTTVTTNSGPFQGPTKVESVRLFYRKDSTEDSKIKNFVVNTDEKYDSDDIGCGNVEKGRQCLLEYNHKGDCVFE